MHKLHRLLALNKAAPGRKFSIENKGDTADVYVYDAIVASDAEAQWWGGVSAENFAKELSSLDASVINIFVNSPGGDVFGGRVMEQAIRKHKATVNVTIDGLAASAASFFIMAADSISMAPGAMMMIHKAWSIAIGNADDMMETASVLEKIDGTLAKTYADRTGMDSEKVAELMASETWMTADEAVSMKFADSVIESKKKASASWDLTAYAKAPKIEAPEDPVFATQEHRERQAQRLRIASRIE